jgi:hypothetical protein
VNEKSVKVLVVPPRQGQVFQTTVGLVHSKLGAKNRKKITFVLFCFVAVYLYFGFLPSTLSTKEVSL